MRACVLPVWTKVLTSIVAIVGITIAGEALNLAVKFVLTMIAVCVTITLKTTIDTLSKVASW